MPASEITRSPEYTTGVKWRNLTLLALAELLAMALWFSATAVIPQLTIEWELSDAQRSWMTMSVQLGFVAGALLSALLNLADRMDSRRLFAASALLGSLCNAAIPALDVSTETALGLRFVTGIFLAGVYPPGMKLMATWCKTDRGLGIGILVGALAMGSALPHLLNAVQLFGLGGMPPWEDVLYGSSALALIAAVVAVLLVRSGPYLNASAPFNWRYALRAVAHRPTRLANIGYLGHMWELYAMWTWVPLLLIAAYQDAGESLQAARLAGFATIGIGAAGCVLAGVAADRIGRTTVAIWSLAISGVCALTAGLFMSNPALLTALCLIWGFAVIADSAQFSAAVSELADTRYVGTALTVQTSMGFLLTLVSIHLAPIVVDVVGWRYGLMFLALGPAAGIRAMLRLRRLPEAARMASGNR